MKFALTSFALAATLSTAVFAHERPTEHKGVTVFDRASLMLGAQVPEMEGFQLRLRQVKLAPGGIVAAHDHSTRPGAYFVISGDGVVEVRGSSKTKVAPGTAVLESQDVDHWIKNEGDEAHFFVFDIVPVDPS